MSDNLVRESDIIFSSATHELKNLRLELRKSNLSVRNRLRSIKKDSEYVCQVADHLGLPLVANERSGSWYIPPHRKSRSAYFKSTDGHFLQWAFSLRRLNLPIFELVAKHGGCIIVDSTRKGKSMPDALSKTVPIWICVFNRLLFPNDVVAGQLKTPRDVVSESEHSQIEKRIDKYVADAKTLGLDLDELRSKLNGNPLNIAWQRPFDDPSDIADRLNKTSNIIVLCTASCANSEDSDYVQGASDDPENWAMGLDSQTFWANHRSLLMANDDDVASLIQEYVQNFKSSKSTSNTISTILVKPTRNIYISTNDFARKLWSDFDVIVSCTDKPDADLTENLKSHYLPLKLPNGKKGGKLLRYELHHLKEIQTFVKDDSKILVTCDTGKDLAVGVALALICLHYDDYGNMKTLYEASNSNSTITKALIHQRLGWIVVSVADANPSRATLQSVNAFLMT